jgi:hypothetical protein
VETSQTEKMLSAVTLEFQNDQVRRSDRHRQEITCYWTLYKKTMTPENKYDGNIQLVDLRERGQEKKTSTNFEFELCKALLT